MEKDTKNNKYTIDAAGRPVGRVSTEAAEILIGKNSTDYKPNLDNTNKVVILNAAQVVFSGKKWNQKVYYRHSLYPGGLKKTAASKLRSEKPQEVIKIAIKNMLPKNKLRNERLKRLSFK